MSLLLLLRNNVGGALATYTGTVRRVALGVPSGGARLGARQLSAVSPGISLGVVTGRIGPSKL
jgi:hypothetical protein